MFRTFIAGAVAAFVGSRLIRMNREGTFEPARQRIIDGASKLRAHLAEQRATLPTPAKRAASKR
ncbi:MAG: hypothetical protein ABS86_02745 [Sphingobium sp. SCN 64-10]|nr:MAG: hypothetical protein ABS86_02745 [Sphingobium sp. SCN 64-10]